MQQAIPYKSWQPFIPLSQYQPPISTRRSKELLLLGVGSGSDDDDDDDDDDVIISNMVSENPVIIFANKGCCMSHVVKRLLQGLGVNPCVYEGDNHEEAFVLNKLEMINKSNNNNSIIINGGGSDQKVQFPAVFIGGKFFGGLDRIMATHITGDLIHVLKEAKALWL